MCHVTESVFIDKRAGGRSLLFGSIFSICFYQEQNMRMRQVPRMSTTWDDEYEYPKSNICKGRTCRGKPAHTSCRLLKLRGLPRSPSAPKKEARQALIFGCLQVHSQSNPIYIKNKRRPRKGPRTLVHAEEEDKVPETNPTPAVVAAAAAAAVAAAAAAVAAAVEREQRVYIIID